MLDQSLHKDHSFATSLFENLNDFAYKVIDINPIVNQNLSVDGQANYKASPIGNGSSKIKFTADTYGVVMGIYRCTPVLDYAHIGIDRSLCKSFCEEKKSLTKFF